MSTRSSAARQGEAMTAKQMVKEINAHCDKGNGIYVGSMGAGSRRYFRAALMSGLAHITPDFGKTWVFVEDHFTFWDGNWDVPIGNLPRKERTWRTFASGTTARSAS